MSQRLKPEFPGDIHDSKFASIGRFLLPWPEVNANEAMIRILAEKQIFFEGFVFGFAIFVVGTCKNGGGEWVEGQISC